MEWKSNLKRTQSLRSVPSGADEPTWTEAGPRNKITSVSQLVARYQTVKVSSSIQDNSVNNDEAKPKQVLKEKTPSILESKDTRLETLMRRNDAREQSRDHTGLTRSKSMGSLQNSGGSIGALKALFESKSATQNKAKSSFRAVQSFSPPNETADILPAVNGEGEKVKSSAEEPKIQIPANAPVNAAKTDAKDRVTQKVVNQTQMERRKTIGGIDFETIAASQADEKRRSIADFRDSSFNQTKEKLCVSVKAMSALYLSKAVPQDSTRSLSKPAQGQSSESGKRINLTKFQPACREMCSACSKKVYPMEKITADKYIFHQTCFCCKQCKKKLSMYNYAPLYGEFYCIFHYQQLFRRKGNYDEGFGRAQHKNRWLLRNAAGVVSHESKSEA